ncbi:hypothetical protein PSH61_19725 [Pseudomonas rhodesiae]|uniref:hypothetical protein n=1 Tax=Pseudomonas TaxID=286 RepID=UPI0027329EFC|nr:MULTISPECIES: hypothetical protein [Pseudomonas]MEA1031562.1 hypothetical protein [Pseudomonas sp. N-137]WLI28035.1 hypothetical protein PSH61_19725 [Pseudomonas rhodesiae]
MENAIFGFIGAFIGSILGFVNNLISTFGKSKDTQLDVRTKVVTNERAQWRKDMRELTATYVSLAKYLTSTTCPKGEDLNEFERTRILIRLRLNADPKHKLDAALLRTLSDIATQTRTESKETLNTRLEEFERNMQALLKREWDKSKNEANSGNIAASDKDAPDIGC